MSIDKTKYYKKYSLKIKNVEIEECEIECRKY